MEILRGGKGPFSDRSGSPNPSLAPVSRALPVTEDHMRKWFSSSTNWLVWADKQNEIDHISIEKVTQMTRNDVTTLKERRNRLPAANDFILSHLAARHLNLTLNKRKKAVSVEATQTHSAHLLRSPLPLNYCALCAEYVSSLADIFPVKRRVWLAVTRLCDCVVKWKCFSGSALFALCTTAARQTGARTCPMMDSWFPANAFKVKLTPTFCGIYGGKFNVVLTQSSGLYRWLIGIL